MLLFAFSDIPKMQFSETIRVTNGGQNVHRQRSHTLAVEYATDNHAVLIK